MTYYAMEAVNPFAMKPMREAQEKQQKPSLNDFYDTHISGVETEFEEGRKEAIRKFWFRLTISILLIGSALVGLLTVQRAGYIEQNGGNALTLFSCLFTTLVIAYTWTNAALNHYKCSVKDVILPMVFNYFGENFYYARHSELKVSDLVASEIIPSYTIAPSEDYVTGSYRGVEVEMMETQLIKQINLGKGRRYPRKIFQGIIIRLEMNKSFNSHTIVEQDSGFIKNWFKKMRHKSMFKKVKLEDTVFEKQFEVYSNDQVDARYLLSPSFMNRLTKLQNVFDGSEIKASFYGKSLLMMIASKADRFEPTSAFKAFDLRKDVEKTVAEMQEILNIIEVLKLDQSTGL